MKRTTIALEEDLFRRIKQEAVRQGQSLKDFLGSLLRQALTARQRPQPYRLKIKPLKSSLRRGVDVADRKSLYEILDGRS